LRSVKQCKKNLVDVNIFKDVVSAQQTGLRERSVTPPSGAQKEWRTERQKYAQDSAGNKLLGEDKGAFSDGTYQNEVS
jgi:hypothetical protein